MISSAQNPPCQDLPRSNGEKPNVAVDEDKQTREVMGGLEKFHFIGTCAHQQEECPEIPFSESGSLHSLHVHEVNAEVGSPICVKEQTLDPMTTSIILEPG